MARSDFTHAVPSEGIWHSLNRFLFTLIVLTLLTTIGYRAWPELAKRKEQELRLEALKAAVEQSRQDLSRNTREENLLMHDPEYQSLLARDRLNVMKPGETIYRLETPAVDKSKMRLNR